MSMIKKADFKIIQSFQSKLGWDFKALALKVSEILMIHEECMNIRIINNDLIPKIMFSQHKYLWFQVDAEVQNEISCPIKIWQFLDLNSNKVIILVIREVYYFELMQVQLMGLATERYLHQLRFSLGFIEVNHDDKIPYIEIKWMDSGLLTQKFVNDLDAFLSLNNESSLFQCDYKNEELKELSPANSLYKNFSNPLNSPKCQVKANSKNPSPPGSQSKSKSFFQRIISNNNANPSGKTSISMKSFHSKYREIIRQSMLEKSSYKHQQPIVPTANAHKSITLLNYGDTFQPRERLKSKFSQICEVTEDDKHSEFQMTNTFEKQQTFKLTELANLASSFIQEQVSKDSMLNITSQTELKAADNLFSRQVKFKGFQDFDNYLFCGDIIFPEQSDFFDSYAYKHCCVYLDENRVFKVSIMDGLDNDFYQIQALDQFTQDQKAVIVLRNEMNLCSDDEIYQRSIQFISKKSKYQLNVENCEKIVNKIVYGKLFNSKMLRNKSLLKKRNFQLSLTKVILAFD
ncbi:UNKNOWN [Stylonychia lemnae]|uniref:Uncharacterized protein n=1 Tax=Stylonychia lemnae TaxID=5949 RepID=A0A078AXX1_STYLE|nr:UNKNOWN [Stylonychia lemnae]|eukprot:CDW86082.1 UNKNOWN [Stylonychia lemnae]